MRFLGIAATALTLVLGTATANSAEGRITIASNNTVSGAWLNPSEHTGSQGPLMVYYAIHDALLKPMFDDNYAKSLAESYTRSADGLTYEFVIRQGATFHNGDPVTAEDAKFSFERYKGTNAALLKSKMASVEAPDARRVIFKLKEPWPDFLNYFATAATGAAWVMPKKYIEAVGDEEFKRKPIGAGPYKLVTNTPGIELVLEAYDNYWRKAPSIKAIVLRSVSDELTRAAMLKSGQADIAFAFKGAQAQDLMDTKGITVKPVVIYFTQWLAFTNQWDSASPWSKQAIREAANLAINREALNKVEYLGFGQPAGNIVAPGVPLAKPLPAYAYDPARAKKLLAEAGYPNGFDAGDLFADITYGTTAEVIQADLAAVGIRLRLRNLEKASYYSLWNEKKLPGVVLSMLAGYENAGAWLEQFAAAGGRGTFGVYPDISDLLIKQSKIADDAERKKMLDSAQDLVRDRAMFAPVIYSSALHAYGPRIANGGIGAIKGYAYIGPYEDLTLNK